VWDLAFGVGVGVGVGVEAGVGVGLGVAVAVKLTSVEWGKQPRGAARFFAPHPVSIR
jgi:hypothetical protein